MMGKFINGVAKGYIFVCLLLGAFLTPMVNNETSKFYELLAGVNILSIIILCALVFMLIRTRKG